MIRRSLIACALMMSGMAAAHARQDAKPETRKWDVADPTGPTTPLAFDTNEGTWMNVDVSPDGTQVVFDLLGDIYIVPIAGSSSPARRVTTCRDCHGTHHDYPTTKKSMRSRSRSSGAQELFWLRWRESALLLIS